jgi:uncharacterized protein DUF4294
MKFLYIIPILLLPILSSGQFESLAAAEYVIKGKIIEGDTLPHIYVKEIIIFPEREFNTKREARRYNRLIRNIKVALPYAKMANNTLTEINNHLLTLDSEQSKKKYINKMDKVLRNEYEEELKKLTISQGRILIKLIDRETGNTSFYLVKELKGNFSAFLWQSLARLFGENLKDDYDEHGEDKLIEEIIILIENGQL